jgi:glycine cleavage system regulatory protein
MSKLGGHFSMMMLVSGSSESIEDIRSTLVSTDTLAYTLMDTEEALLGEANVPEFSAYFSLEGADRPGLVARLTRLFAELV